MKWENYDQCFSIQQSLGRPRAINETIKLPDLDFWAIKINWSQHDDQHQQSSTMLQHYDPDIRWRTVGHLWRTMMHSATLAILVLGIWNISKLWKIRWAHKRNVLLAVSLKHLRNFVLDVTHHQSRERDRPSDVRPGVCPPSPSRPDSLPFHHLGPVWGLGSAGQPVHRRPPHLSKLQVGRERVISRSGH